MTVLYGLEDRAGFDGHAIPPRCGCDGYGSSIQDRLRLSANSRLA
jgi:hypothetical protein